MRSTVWQTTMLLVTTVLMGGAAGGRVLAAETLYAVPFADGVVVAGPSGVQLRVSMAAWGPAFKWAGLSGKLVQAGDGAAGEFKMTIDGAPGKVAVAVKKTGPRQLELNYELTVERDISLNMVAVMVEPGDAFAGKDRLLVTSPAGKKPLAVPVPVGNSVEGATGMTLTDAAGVATELRMEPGILLWGEKVARLVLAKDTLAANTPRQLKLTIALPADVAWYASAADLPDAAGIDKWFPWQPKQDVEGDESAIGMQKWFDAPAGAAGRIVNRDGRLFTGDKPVRLWGINSNYGENYPDAPEAARRAAWFAKYGINCVRLHKMAGSGFGFLGIRSKTSAIEFDPVQLDKLDRYTAELGKRGIYYAFSPNYPFSIGPGDRDRVESFDEIYKGTGDEANGSDVVYASPKVQELLIEQATRLLNHVNPYTQKAYKDDPALAYVECINEESDMFYGYTEGVASKPTYRRLFAERFSDWLKAKYGSQEKLVAAWGEPAFQGPFEAKLGIQPGESLDKRDVYPGGNPWYWDPAQLAGSQKAYAKRYFDTMAFLAEAENDFYGKWSAALRKAGYAGMLDFSNWQAGRGFSHLYNLEADSRAGMIDRHNYFGGMNGIGLGLGAFNNDSMLARPGSGILSTGMQQVEGCTFVQSEWIHVLPNEWAAEGPAIVGAYGFGLQGWDMDFIFTQGNTKFEDRIDKGNIWNAYHAPVMGLFPAVARQVIRGDVTEAPLVASMNAHVASFAEGKGIDFEDTTSQSHDVKSFDCDKVPTETLARGRVAVKFTKEMTPSVAPAELQDLRTAATIESVTKQLVWTRGTGPRDGYFTMDTPATKAVVGFADGKVCKLGAAEIVHRNPFAAVYLTCIDREATDIAKASRLLVVAVARCRNTGMKFAGDAGMLLDKGKGPMLVEPVSAEIRLNRPGTPTVYVLDHDGRRTDKTVALKDGKIVLDGAENKTIYYEIVY